MQLFVSLTFGVFAISNAQLLLVSDGCPTKDLCSSTSRDPITSTSIMLDVCSFMYCNTSYSDSGVPCGFGTEDTAECDGVDPISFRTTEFTSDEMDALTMTLALETLQSGVQIEETLLNNGNPRHIEITEDAEVNVTLITEGACFQVWNLLTFAPYPRR